jgi:hypothetical protein
LDRARKNGILRILWFFAGVMAMIFIWSRPSDVPYFPAQSLSAEQPAPVLPADGDGSVILGDLNKDGVLDAADVLALQNLYLIGTTDISQEEQLQMADINADGLIDTSDTALLTAYITDNTIDHGSVSLHDYASGYSG